MIVEELRSCVSSVLRKAQTGIGATKPETIGQCGLDSLILRHSGNIVAVKFFGRITRTLEIESRRENILMQLANEQSHGCASRT